MKKILAIGFAAILTAFIFAEPVTSSSGNKLGSLGNVTISVDKDYSKKNPATLKGATVEEVEYLNEKCVKATKNKNGELRLAFMFDESVPATDLKYLQYSIAGFDGYSGHYNIGVMYEDMKSAEHNMSCYTSKYVKSIAIANGVITATVQGLNNECDGKTIVLKPKINATTKNLEWVGSADTKCTKYVPANFRNTGT